MTVRYKRPGNFDRPAYLHGGGYAFYGKAYASLIAYVARAARAPAFALDYRLIPEHPYPAQLDDALAAYRWLLERAGSSQRLVVAGDSAGGHLALTLLLKLRELKLPMPLLSICLGPWVDLRNGGDSMTANSRYDWIEKRMAEQWARWLCPDADLRDPSLSPVEADLRGLAPLYVQAGSAEILLDQIRGFAERAKAQGADLHLDVWAGMTHDFQGYGDGLPESRAALARIGEVIAARRGGTIRTTETSGP